MATRLEKGTYIGTSPAGVEWRCYWDSEAKVEAMRANLVKKWKRGESVRVRNLTEAQIDHIYWANALYCEGAGIPEEVCEYGKTYVEAPVDILLSTWERLEGTDADVDIDPLEFDYEATDAQIEFAYRAKRKSIQATVRKLAEVLEPYTIDRN